MQHGPGIAARHMLGGFLLPRRALGMALAIAGFGVLHRLVEIDIGQIAGGVAGLGIGHGSTGSPERRWRLRECREACQCVTTGVAGVRFASQGTCP